MKLAAELDVIDMRLAETDNTRFELDVDRKPKPKFLKFRKQRPSRDYGIMLAINARDNQARNVKKRSRERLSVVRDTAEPTETLPDITVTFSS